ncbi:Isotrichodermin C-15 hydroxylase [Sphaceloma murrayae]|uniref:Isotrichodermin C-15 hydroxylase n=1 Tax=Sphaceloma murrayae TaxID=2082308 RepID=A0A2K1QKE5_9PEZI|nr:Isotrichodermin C-15 hydroxylase [Sphaceloma murrayae]
MDASLKTLQLDISGMVLPSFKAAPAAMIPLTSSFLSIPAYFIIVSLCAAIFWYFTRPFHSSFRHLPRPNQGLAVFRIFHEPNINEIETWIDSVPNKGLIRYYGAYNKERLLVTEPSSVRDLLKTEAYNFVKPKLQHILANNIANKGLLILEGDEHKVAKKGFAGAFQPQRVSNVYPLFWKVAADLQTCVASELKSGHSKIVRPVSAAAIDSIGQWGYSKNLEALTNPKARFARSYLGMFKMTPIGQTSLRIAALTDPEIVMSLPLRAAKTITGVMDYVRNFSTEIVKEHACVYEAQREGKATMSDDMLSMIMQSDVFNERQLVDQTVHFLAAATETSAGTTCWGIHLLSRHTDVQTRLRQEIRLHLPSPALLRDGRIDADRASAQVFDQMPYLSAVVKEILRFHSINTLLWRECVQKATLAGQEIPPETLVVYSPWAINRSPKHWGPDSKEFKPERWLKDANGGADEANCFLTFGAGPRRCIGEQYAVAQIKSFIAALVGRFEFKPLHENGTDDGEEIGSNYALTLFKIYEGWELAVREVEGW